MIIASLIAFLNLCSALIIFTNKGNMNIAYLNLIVVVLIAIWIGFVKLD